MHGVKSMLGHTVGSVAGSVALITGSLGRALAMLSFDKQYSQVVHPKTLNKHTLLALCGWWGIKDMGVGSLSNF